MSTTLIQNKPLYDGLKVTREEYLDLEDDGFKYDMIDGVLYMSPSPFSKHGECQVNLNYCLREYFKKKMSGKAINEVDIYLPDGEDVLRPDITIILKENYGINKGHIHGVPDIVVEILSESTYKRDLGIKADRYLSNGVKEYWIVDTDEKNISIWINNNNGSPTAGLPKATSSSTKSWNKKEGNDLESSVLSGFILKQEEVFPE